MNLVKQVILAHSALQRLVDSDKANSYVFPWAARLAFAINLTKARPVAEAYQAQHEKLVISLGEPDPNDPTVIKVKDENQAEFFEQNKRMLDAQTEIVFDQVDGSSLGDNQLPIDLIALLKEAGILK